MSSKQGKLPTGSILSQKSITWENSCNKRTGPGIALSKIKISVLTNGLSGFPSN